MKPWPLPTMRAVALVSPILFCVAAGGELRSTDDFYDGVAAGEEAIHVLTTRFGLAPVPAAPPRAEGEGPWSLRWPLASGRAGAPR